MLLLTTPSTFNAISSRDRRSGPSEPRRRTNGEKYRRRVDCGQLDPGAVILPVPEDWHPRMPQRLDEEELADWRAGRNAVYQLAA
jgi:hypothetical protein